MVTNRNKQQTLTSTSTHMQKLLHWCITWHEGHNGQTLELTIRLKGHIKTTSIQWYSNDTEIFWHLQGLKIASAQKHYQRRPISSNLTCSLNITDLIRSVVSSLLPTGFFSTQKKPTLPSFTHISWIMPRTPKAAKCTKNLKIATYQRLNVQQLSVFRKITSSEGMFLVPPCLFNRISLNECFPKV